MEIFKKMPWTIFALLIFSFYGVLTWSVLAYPQPDTSLLGKLMKDFQGNLTAGWIANICFLLLAIKLDQATSSKIDRIQILAEKNEDILKQRESILTEERKRSEFEKFMRIENYHNALFPKICSPNHPFGLEYTIRPIRDSSSTPKSKSTEMSSYYLIEILKPADEEVLKEDQFYEYETSPIKEQCYYYCNFFNGSWHMSEDGVLNWHEFYLSSKVGPSEFVISANEFMGLGIEPENMEMIATLFLTEDGAEYSRKNRAAVDKYTIYKGPNESLYLKINHSALKPFYLRNSQENPNNWDLHVDYIRGYASGQKLINIKNFIRSNLEDKKIKMRRVPFTRFL